MHCPWNWLASPETTSFMALSHQGDRPKVVKRQTVQGQCKHQSINSSGEAVISTGPYNIKW